MTEPIDKLRRLSPEQRRQLREKLSKQLNTQHDEPACRPERISLYFFASSAGTSASEYYQMVMAAAESADRGGLHAIWVPERHFVDFGAYSPNPALLATAIAARTERVRVCAGSVVAPLQHPIRIAEDWALLDNLSGGRVGISFASGWHPQDLFWPPTTKGNDVKPCCALWIVCEASGGVRRFHIAPRPAATSRWESRCFPSNRQSPCGSPRLATPTRSWRLRGRAVES